MPNSNSRRRRLTVSAGVVLFFIAVTGLHAQEGTVSFILGTVSISGRGGTSAAEIGSPVRGGERVRTGRDSSAVLEFPQGLQVKLRQDTVFIVENVGDNIDVTLGEGSAFSRISGRLTGAYRVRAASAVMGVRGTEFFVAYGRTVDEAPDVWMCVNSGSVEVMVDELSESLLVREGEGINILAGSRPTPPRAYGWTRGLNWNMDPAAGTVEDRSNLDRAYADLLDADYD